MISCFFNPPAITSLVVAEFACYPPFLTYSILHHTNNLFLTAQFILLLLWINNWNESTSGCSLDLKRTSAESDNATRVRNINLQSISSCASSNMVRTYVCMYNFVSVRNQLHNLWFCHGLVLNRFIIVWNFLKERNMQSKYNNSIN